MEQEADTELPENRVKIVVVGGGATGSVIIRVLRIKTPYEIICADKNPKRARMYLKGIKGLRIIKTKSAKDLYEQIKKEQITVLVNAASSTMNLLYLEMAVKLGISYFDLSSFNDHEAEQSKNYHERFVKKGLKGFFNFASAPGLTNIIVAELIEDLEWADVKIFVLEQTDSKQAIYPWNPRLVLDEARSRVPQFINWKYREAIEAFSKWSWHKFIGLAKRTRCFAINENEAITLPRFLKNIRTLTVRCGGSDPQAIKIFVEKNGSNHSNEDLYRLMPATPTPEELDILLKSGLVKNGRFRLEIEAKGMKHGYEIRRKAWISFPTLKMFHKVLNANHVSGPSGIMAALGIILLVECDFVGLVPPERLNAIARKFIFARLAKMNLKVHFSNSRR